MHNIRPHIPLPFTKPGSLLYVGARVDACAWLDELEQAGNQITLCEIWGPNAEGFVGRLFDVWNVDVVKVGELIQLYQAHFDYIWWWHGPEHLNLERLERFLPELESYAHRLIALACPWGDYPQGEHEGNPYERHLASLHPEFFTERGYQVHLDGAPDQAGSEIAAWKVVR